MKVTVIGGGPGGLFLAILLKKANPDCSVEIYERNDYIRFPSYVTVDLAIDLTHQYFDAVLRRVEQEHLAARLTKALQGFAQRAIAVRDGAKTAAARKAAGSAAVYWATALRLRACSVAVGSHGIHQRQIDHQPIVAD